MRPHATLFLALGATLRASLNGSDYLPQYAASPQGTGGYVAGHLIGGEGAHHARVVGRGVLDGQCQQFLTGLGRGPNEPTQFTFRPLSIPGHGEIRVGVIAFAHSVDVAVEGVTLSDSHAWTAAFFNVTGLVVANVNVYGDWRMPNNDGLDICSCTDVLVDGVNIDTGDDCISPKTNVLRGDGSGGFLPLHNLTVRNSRLRSRSFGVKWGTETRGDMSEVRFDNIQIHNAHHGIGIDWRGAGHFRDATFTNINLLRTSWVGSGSYLDQNWMGAAQSISITNNRELLGPGEVPGTISNVLFENITTVSENSAVYVSACTEHGKATYDSHGLCTEGLPPGAISNITFVNVVAVIQQNPGNNASNGPHTSHDDTTGSRNAAPIDAFFVEYASDVTFHGCSAAFAGAPAVSTDCNLKGGCENIFGVCLRIGNGTSSGQPQSLVACVPPATALEPVSAT